ncbi:MAG: PAS domain-containing sensor histidine kinase [Verrucomicrobiaceae bacterium]|nr:PAS domain-containing sensor histidine kinase [Verrucomicrobiaceae bacterium]
MLSSLGALVDETSLLTWAGVLGIIVLASCIVLLRRAQALHEDTKRQLKAQEDMLGATEQRWKLLFEQSPLSIQIFDPSGQTILFNQAWRDLFRLPDEIGYAFNPLKDPDLIKSGAVEHIKLAFAGQPVRVPPVPFPVNTDPPEVRWIGGILYPVKDKSGRMLEVVTIHNDVTDTKRAEEAMLKVNQTLELRVAERTKELEEVQSNLAKALDAERDLSALKSRFVSMVSHEFRTPLGVTMSAVELLRNYSDRLPDDQKSELLDDIKNATTSMASLMEQVLVLGRVEAGKLGFKPRLIELHALVSKIVEEITSITGDKCPIELLMQPETASIQADETLLRHIFNNLIGNAVKYSPEGEKVTFSAEKDGEHLVCSVADRGIGIPDKDRAHLYEAFHRCENVGEIQGSGLGLVIVKRCVEMHSGTISFESVVNHGTTFTVKLPVFAAS